jgi:predicted RecA/RadA family phage recombinase
MEKKFYVREASSSEGKNADWSGAGCFRFPNLKRTPVKVGQASSLSNEHISTSKRKNYADYVGADRLEACPTLSK